MGIPRMNYQFPIDSLSRMLRVVEFVPFQGQLIGKPLSCSINGFVLLQQHLDLVTFEWQ
jgi:hypothetical protein